MKKIIIFFIVTYLLLGIFINLIVSQDGAPRPLVYILTWPGIFFVAPGQN